jgi:hypothetical protein
MRQTPLILAALALALGPAARADTIEVSSTTLVTAGEQTRGGAFGEERDLATVVPAYEILSITARGITNPVADDLSIVLSSWGAYDFADRRWDRGTESSLTGDVMAGYVQGRLADRRVTLRLGREHVMTGVARMLHIDGGDAVVVLPLGFRVSAYAGVPVSQRFASRSGIRSWNPVGGNVAYGGRVGWSLSVPGVSGRGLDIGVSHNAVEDDGDPVRQELGADFRVLPFGNFTVTGFAAFSLYDERFSEGQVLASWSATRRVHVTADYRYIEPDLLLARNSILSVFADSSWNEVGAGATYNLGRGVDVGADYHLRIEPPARQGGSDELGHDAVARASLTRGPTQAGAEVSFLDTFENGYVGTRIFGRQGFGKAFGAADLIAHFFREDVNGERLALTGTLSAGYELARGFSAVVSGRAGVTPFLEQTYDVMAKLVYNQTYTRREVR